MGAHRGELGGASLVRFLAESIVGYLGGKGGGGIVLFPPQISVDFLREVVPPPLYHNFAFELAKISWNEVRTTSEVRLGDPIGVRLGDFHHGPA